MLIDDSELPTKHPPHIDVASVWLKALIVAQNLQFIDRIPFVRVRLTT